MAADAETRRLLSKIARAYYEDGLTQEQIGVRLGLSRIKVSRLLSRAREEGIVHISVTAPPEANADVERELEGAWGLNEAVVVPSLPGGGAAMDELGRAAAECVVRGLERDSVLGLTWGTALLALADAMLPQSWPEVRVVQLLGGLGRPESEVYGSDLARRIAGALGARLRFLPSPGIVASPAVRDALLADPQIADTLALGARADVAVVGLGRPTAGSVVMQAGILSPQELAELEGLGAVGDIALRFFDAEGRAVRHDLDRRIVGLDLDQIRAIPRVIGVAGGPAKTEVIRAALRGRLIDVLVTDAGTAARLLPAAGRGAA